MMFVIIIPPIDKPAKARSILSLDTLYALSTNGTDDIGHNMNISYP